MGKEIRYNPNRLGPLPKSNTGAGIVGWRAIVRKTLMMTTSERNWRGNVSRLSVWPAGRILDDPLQMPTQQFVGI